MNEPRRCVTLGCSRKVHASRTCTYNRCTACLDALLYGAFGPDRPQDGERHAGGHPANARAVLQAATA